MRLTSSFLAKILYTYICSALTEKCEVYLIHTSRRIIAHEILITSQKYRKVTLLKFQNKQKIST